MTHSNEDLQLHIVELESKLAFQEDAVHSLSNELREHQKRIDLLQRQLMLLAERLHNLPEEQGILRPEEEPLPPHY